MFGSNNPSNNPFGGGGGGGGFGTSNQSNTGGGSLFGSFGTASNNSSNSTTGSTTFGGKVFGGGSSTVPTSNTFGGGGSGGLFGSTPAPAPTFGPGSTLFGAPAPAPSTSLFGGGGGGGGLFGSSGFGTNTSNTFGGTAPSTSTTFFGSTTPAAPTPAFGSTAPTSTFGSSGLFGSPTPASFGGGASGFGVTPSSTPAVGTRAVPFNATVTADGSTNVNLQSITAMPPYQEKSPQELRYEDYLQGNKGQPSVGGTMTTSGFGSTLAGTPSFSFASTQPSTSLFGSSPVAAPAAGFGTTSTFGGFGAASTKPSTAFGTTTTFGSPSSSSGFGTGGGGGLFGSSNTFGAAPSTGGSLFGSPAPAPAFGGGFGGSTTGTGGSVFGAAPSTGGLFGTSTPTPAAGSTFGGGGSFGASSMGSNTPTPFGAPNPGSSFGGGLFRSPAPASSFGSAFGGASTAPSGGLFGTTAPAPSGGGVGFGVSSANPPGTSLFASPAPSTAVFGFGSRAGGFGASQAPAFGTSTFGAPAPLSSSFTSAGTTSAPSFFGAAPAPAAPSIFGSTPAPAYPQYASQPAPTPFSGTGTSLFGAAPAATPLQQQQQQQQQQPSQVLPPQASPYYSYSQSYPSSSNILPANSVIIPKAANEVLAQQLRALELQRQELEHVKLCDHPPGAKKSSAAPTVSKAESSWAQEEEDLWLPRSATMTPFLRRAWSSSSSPRLSTSTIRPRGFPQESTTTTARNKTVLSSAPSRQNNGNHLRTPESFLKSQALHLVIKPESLNSKPKLGLKLPSTIQQERKEIHEQQRDASPVVVHDSPVIDLLEFSTPENNDREDPQELLDRSPSLEEGNLGTHGKQKLDAQPREQPSPAMQYYKRVIGQQSPESEDQVNSYDHQADFNTKTETHRGRSSVVPKLTRKDYKVTPSLDKLAMYTEADLATVENFSVERPGFALIEWEGSVDVRGADLDRIVVIEQQVVSVYDQDEEEGTKPPVGSQLNRPATISFYNVFPKAGGATASVAEKNKFATKVQRTTQKMGAEFVSYDTTTGEWIIRVKHF